MFYEFPITVPASTTEASPTTQNLEIGPGIIQRIDVQFLFGCGTLVHARLESHNFGTLPSIPSDNISADGNIVPINGPIDFLIDPYIIKATLWNDDDTYQHIVTIRIDLVESEDAIRFARILAGLSKFLKLVGIKV